MAELAILSPSELETMLIRAARLGASQAIEALDAERAPDVMNKAQVAKYLNKSEATINRWMNVGLPYESPNGGYPVFYRSAVDAWMKGR